METALALADRPIEGIIKKKQKQNKTKIESIQENKHIK
jgi:hypothetical protein